MSPYRALEVITKEIESGRQTVSVNKALRAAESALKMQTMSECKKLYVVTADTHTDGWIPVEERLPDEYEKVLVWYEYYRFGAYNCMYETYGIGYQYDGHWSGDVQGVNARCIAWQSLPEPYKAERSE